MPKIRRRNLPPALLDHLLDRIHSREISPEQLSEFAQWLDTEPEVGTGRWFKRFSGMIVCGEGELVKTFFGRARPRQAKKCASFLSPLFYFLLQTSYFNGRFPVNPR